MGEGEEEKEVERYINQARGEAHTAHTRSHTLPNAAAGGVRRGERGKGSQEPEQEARRARERLLEDILRGEMVIKERGDGGRGREGRRGGGGGGFAQQPTPSSPAEAALAR